jgi:hypothetical protein
MRLNTLPVATVLNELKSDSDMAVRNEATQALFLLANCPPGGPARTTATPTPWPPRGN